ncbi:MAG TPA: carboxymuconolactone decarboxylase family protein [Syntrophorhabdaceae bacterium]|nr:carboxymuconolactone decarboxylase family protein [Syntrophorhabdaceae bacterium]HPA07198.1 carboxymuconolactone decarboxylase family protein [Methanoregulaceae archaeon]
MISIEKLPKGRWHLMPVPRVQPLQSGQYTLFQSALFWVTRRAAKARQDLNVFPTFARLGAAFPPYLWFLSHILNKGQIPGPDKSRIILRAGWRLGCVYEWVHHVHRGRDFGLTEAEIASFATEGVSELWSERTRAFVKAVDELIANQNMSDQTWDCLRQHLTEDQMVEFCMLVGHYIMVAIMNNTLGIQVEPEFEQLP